METSRVELALNVSNIETATRFYAEMFGIGLAKEHAGYANFEIADPPLELVLFEHPQATSPRAHLGVEVGDDAAVAQGECCTTAPGDDAVPCCAGSTAGSEG